MDDYEKHGEAAWVELIGPFTDAAGVAERLDASPRDVARLTGSSHLLALVTADDATVYPAFQFTELDWRTLGLYLWAAGYDRGAPYRAWRIAAWLRSPHPLLFGRAPVDVIRQGGADGVLLRLVASETGSFRDEPGIEGASGPDAPSQLPSVSEFDGWVVARRTPGESTTQEKHQEDGGVR